MNLDEIITRKDFTDFKEELPSLISDIIKKEVSGHLAKRWIRANELQDLTGWSSSTIQTYRINGTLIYSKVGGTVFYDLRHLMNLLEKNSNL
jgi:hypothetical protein